MKFKLNQNVGATTKSFKFHGFNEKKANWNLPYQINFYSKNVEYLMNNPWKMNFKYLVSTIELNCKNYKYYRAKYILQCRLINFKYGRYLVGHPLILRQVSCWRTYYLDLEYGTSAELALLASFWTFCLNVCLKF